MNPKESPTHIHLISLGGIFICDVVRNNYCALGTFDEKVLWNRADRIQVFTNFQLWSVPVQLQILGLVLW